MRNTPILSQIILPTLIPCALILSAFQASADTDLTIYNQNFAVVRDTVNLDLKPGINRVQVSDVTAMVEPDSVVLRDPSGQRQLQVMEQFYRADPISQGLLLSQYEGQTIGFRVRNGDKEEIVQGKIIRSGYSPDQSQPYPYGNPNYYAPNGAQPIIEVNGQLRFSLPGEPIFPALPADAILKPTLNWVIQAEQGGPLAAEMAYITNGMSWKADYNLVAPSDSIQGNEKLELTGWVTLSNNTGKSFDNAHIKLMAGDISKLGPEDSRDIIRSRAGYAAAPIAAPTGVTEKPFDDYHLYTLAQTTALHNRETKQVEFTRAPEVKATRAYVYDGAELDDYSGYSSENIRDIPNYGVKSNSKVWIVREFLNNTANGLGIPLPKGRLRFYQRDASGQVEFLGENNIDHTPTGESVKAYTGNAFDIVGERKRTAYKVDNDKDFLDESFQITLRNHKSNTVEVRVREHLYRGDNWTIPQHSNTFLKEDSNTVEFRVQVPANGTQVLTYNAHYTW